MPETLQTPEIPQQQWTPITNLVPLDYWVGANYNGSYRNRLQVNLPLMEELCRKNDFPPICIESLVWNPPPAKEPEMIAPGLSAFKIFDRKKPEGQREYEGSIATIRGMDIQLANISIGWAIDVKDRKITHDFAAANPLATNTEVDENFETQLNKSLRNSLLKIALLETFHLRETDTKLAASLTIDTFFQILASGGGAFMDEVGNSERIPDWFEAVFTNGMAQMAVDTGSDKVIRKSRQDGFNIGMAASNEWRKYVDPERYALERHGQSFAKDKMLKFIPFGIIFKKFYSYASNFALHGKPLVRLAPSSQ